MDLHDVRMSECRKRRGFTTETDRLFLACIRPRQQHLECDSPIQFLLPGLEDHAHAATAKDGFDFVAAYNWKHDLSAEPLNMAVLGWIVVTEHLVELNADALNLLQAFADCGQKVGRVGADFSWGPLRFQYLFDELPNSQFIRHSCLPRPKAASDL